MPVIGINKITFVFFSYGFNVMKTKPFPMYNTGADSSGGLSKR